MIFLSLVYLYFIFVDMIEIIAAFIFFIYVIISSRILPSVILAIWYFDYLL